MVAVGALLCVTHGKVFAVSEPAFAVCLWHTANVLFPVVTGRVEAIVLSLETMQAKLAFLKHKDLSIVCPYETMDFAACIPAMNQF